jgi:hypothetical protein
MGDIRRIFGVKSGEVERLLFNSVGSRRGAH